MATAMLIDRDGKLLVCADLNHPPSLLCYLGRYFILIGPATAGDPNSEQWLFREASPVTVSEFPDTSGSSGSPWDKPFPCAADGCRAAAKEDCIFCVFHRSLADRRMQETEQLLGQGDCEMEALELRQAMVEDLDRFVRRAGCN